MSEISVKYAFTESKYRLGMVSKGKNADCRWKLILERQQAVEAVEILPSELLVCPGR